MNQPCQQQPDDAASKIKLLTITAIATIPTAVKSSLVIPSPYLLAVVFVRGSMMLFLLQNQHLEYVILQQKGFPERCPGFSPMNQIDSFSHRVLIDHC